MSIKWRWIDTDKYEGHTEDIERWQMMGRSLPHWANKKDEQLVRDAVYLLEEVKRLRMAIYDSLYILETDEWSEEGSMDKLIQTLKDGWDWYEDYFAEMKKNG